MMDGKAEDIGDGHCPICGVAAKARTCSEDGAAVWVLDCGHAPQLTPFKSDFQPGSHPDCDYCGECARGGTCPLL
ncbi:MAG: hypothetical protein IIB38_04730 [Candidatus Hydrogenedentes bacterium]|nr:hypothetical protein [Candidatus Hydrogenedentota bacterium]